MNADCSAKKFADGASRFVNLACLITLHGETKCKGALSSPFLFSVTGPLDKWEEVLLSE